MKSANNANSLPAEELDRIDRRILATLQEQGRISNQELAAAVHLSPAQCHRRHRRLERLGYIQHYQARLNADRLGLGVMAYVNLTMEPGQFKEVNNFRQVIGQLPEVLECHAVTGDFDYVCKVVASDLKALSNFLLGTLAQLPGVTGVRSTICLEELKSTSALPIN